MSGSDGNKVLWEDVDNHIFEEPKDNDEIVLRGFGFNFSKYGGGGKKRIERLYLFININKSMYLGLG